MADKKPSIFDLRLPPHYMNLVESYKPQPGKGGQNHGHHGPGGHWRRQVEHAHSPMKCFMRILGLARARSLWIAIVLTLAIISSAIAIVTPMLMKSAVDCLNLLEKDKTADLSALLQIIMYMAAIYAFSWLLSFLQGWFSEKLAQDTLCEMRRQLFEHLQLLPLKFFDSRTHGEILSRATNDVAMVSQLMSRGIVTFLVSLLSLVCAFVAMVMLSPTLTVAALLTLPLSIFLTKYVGGHIRTCFVSHQTSLGLLNGHIEEIMSSQKIVKAFNHEAKAKEDFHLLNREMLRVALLAHILSGSMWPLMNQLNNIGFAILVGTGGYLAAKGSITIGVIAAFIQYSRQFTRPATEIANQYNEIQSAIAGAERVFAIMDEPVENDCGRKSLPQSLQGRLTFDHVAFSYKESEPVLTDFTLDIKPGSKIALVGTTGAGKTTVASLLMRFYNIKSGTISIDGTPITEYPLSELRRAIAIVLQETWLFTGTIRDNIRYGRLESTDAEVEAAAAAIGADTFITRLPDGYDTVIGENGGNLSQGQRQLIAIARAVLANAPLLILDEATSNVDTRTELLVQKAMIHLMKGRTCIVIAHRLSTIRDADSIIVLSGGKIAEQGTREELLNAHGAYWELEQSSLNL